MSTFSLTPKRKKALEVVQYFVPDYVKWGHRTTRLTSYDIVGVRDMIQSRLGVSPEEAFFMKSEQGKLPPRVKSIPKLVALLWGQRWMATQIQMWKDGVREGVFIPSDFDDEPSYIQDLFMRKVWNTEWEYTKDYKKVMELMVEDFVKKRAYGNPDYPVYEDMDLHDGKFQWKMMKHSDIQKNKDFEKKYRWSNNGIYIRR